MAVIPRIRHIEFRSAPPENPDAGAAEVRVNLEDGSASTFPVLTPNHVSHRMNEAGQDFLYGAPSLFVKRLDQEGLAKAADAMATDMSGFWLRYYNTGRDEKKKAKGKKK
ncbi:MAG: hypothetical protein PHU21_12405 [Elusimicrobia bacterium]|nr:hypothetical protein [Elusimicrobiota bacterium]